MNKKNENIEKFSGRTPIKKRGIYWQEKYTDRTQPLKERFEQEIGPGSYYRWEGHDSLTNGDYFIVVSPSIKYGVGKMFFAGIKRYPPIWKRQEGKYEKVYAPFGKYFVSMISALGYASRKWGVPFPPDQMDYDQSSIENVNIPKHLKA